MESTTTQKKASAAVSVIIVPLKILFIYPIQSPAYPDTRLTAESWWPDHIIIL